MSAPMILLGLLAAVAVTLGSRLSPYDFAWLRVHLFSGLAVASWYLSGTTASRYTNTVVFAAIAGYAAVYVYRNRPRPGWWGGAHERIEQG